MHATMTTTRNESGRPVQDDGCVVETFGLTKRFGQRTAVDGVDLHIPRGIAFGYLGPNGAGKTTLIRMLLGLTPATAGTMRILGRPVPAQRGSALARVGAFVEEPRFHGFLTGRENLEVVAAARDREAHVRIDAALERTGLTDRASERVDRYSLGMRQRLGVARTLLGDPELLILDEPTNGLDPAGILEFRGMVRTLVEEGRTVVLSSHLLDEVEKICDTVAIVDHGRVVAQGTIDEIATTQQKSILVTSNDDTAAATCVRPLRSVASIATTDDGIRVTLNADVEVGDTAADINRRLVESGLAVRRLEPSRVSLEERFLEITSRLGEST
jgi:ABC-2 type transport system ATP-binding protein